MATACLHYICAAYLSTACVLCTLYSAQNMLRKKSYGGDINCIYTLVRGASFDLGDSLYKPDAPKTTGMNAKHLALRASNLMQIRAVCFGAKSVYFGYFSIYNVAELPRILLVNLCTRKRRGPDGYGHYHCVRFYAPASDFCLILRHRIS